MKKVVLLTYCCLLMELANAQNGKYIPFPSSMIIYGYTLSGYASSGDYINHRLEIGGDTIINSIHYMKQYAEKTVTAGIRNDIPNKKVYRYLFNTHAEELLYDFDLNVGDTIFKKNGFGFFPDLFLTPLYIKIDTAWVFRIDSILMPHDNLYHKRFNFMAKVKPLMSPSVLANSDKLIHSGTVNIKIEPLIEGVGEYYNAISEFDDKEYFWSLRYFCISIDKKTIISDPGPGMSPPHDPALCNTIITNVAEEIGLNRSVLFPNPSNGKLELRTKPSINNHFEINDILGKKIYASKIENETTAIDLRDETPGIYFIRIYSTTGNSQTLKLIIN
jgi:hypothetical protein